MTTRDEDDGFSAAIDVFKCDFHGLHTFLEAVILHAESDVTFSLAGNMITSLNDSS